MFDSVLIANRGEIAVRIARTCRELGIRTIAVFSDADRDAPHVRACDEAVHIGPAPATESYLVTRRILEAAQQTGAQAIHPGYGFLSENADFARAVGDAGLTWIGPAPETIVLMGDKAAAKVLMREHGVPVVQGIEGNLTDDEILAVADAQVGFPLLVKAVAGGGGKGMRAVHSAADLPDALLAARREARNAFGDDQLLLEQLIVRPRHIELQVFGDTFGNVVHLGERDCSVQRRHQKVVEETPSPALDDALRAEMAAAAVAAARAVDYVGAGTVEFILGEDGRFAFLEMNTRLQVEHPVTELVTGTDLVAWQLAVAAGQALPKTQDEITFTGHALEVRLYAEDPANGFLPQTGTVLDWSPPAGARVDDGVGAEVSRFYDPMLAKIIVHADDRNAAITAMLAALADTRLFGVNTNLGFLADVVGHPAFAEGDVTTAFLDEHDISASTAAPSAAALAAAAAVRAKRPAARLRQRTRPDPFSTIGPWRASGVGGQVVRFDDGPPALVTTATTDDVVVRVGEDAHTVSIRRLTRGRGRARRAHVTPIGHDGRPGGQVQLVVATSRDDDDVWVHADGRVHRVTTPAPTRHADLGALAGDAAFQAPMPGSVIAVNVADGQHVTAGTTLVVVEAMKMEQPIIAPTDGTVDAVHVTAGSTVDAGQLLLSFTADED